MKILSKLPLMNKTNLFQNQNLKYGSDYGLVNILFVGIGLLLLGSVAVRAAVYGVSRVNDAVHVALRPYTAEGRLETCMSNIYKVGSALSMYEQDFDDHFPPLSYTTTSKKPITWPDLVAGHGANPVGAGMFQCAAKGASSTGDSIPTSYGLSSVLAGSAIGKDNPDADNADSHILILADRGDADNLAVFSMYENMLKNTTPPYNVDFRHSDKAVILYKDNHAKTLISKDELSDPLLWAGGYGITRAARGLIASTPVLAAVDKALKDHNEKAGRTAVAANIPAAMQAFTNLELLWKANDSKNLDPNLDAIGWMGAQYLRDLKHPEFEAYFVKEQSERSKTELDDANRGQFRRATSDGGFTIEIPDMWTQSQDRDPDYQQYYFHTHSPHIFVMVERGRGKQFATSSAISWAGVDRTLSEKFGSHYHRIGFGNGVLSGMSSTSLDYEIERPGQPRLKSRIIGFRRGFDSYTLKIAAPVADFPTWEQTFERIKGSFIAN